VIFNNVLLFAVYVVVSCLSFKIKMILDDYSYYVRMLLAIIRSNWLRQQAGGGVVLF